MGEQGAVAPAVESILDAARRRETRARKVSVDARSFEGALRDAEADGRVPVVAEIKPTSPTTDGTRTDDPADLAESMVAGGAAALSVLTEPTQFEGSPETLREVRAAVDVPVLRKDFILGETQLDTVAADVVLLIARFVDDLEGLVAAAQARGFQVLVEAHTRSEVEAAEAAGADVVGINNRDLAALSVDLGTFESVSPAASGDVPVLAESGIETQADVRRMRSAGADGLLIGSAIMDGDVQANTRRLTQT